jgi:AraC-like DNA-binding protein
VGETPSDLLRRARLERAAALLGTGTGTVADVAYAAGFQSISYFTRAFQQQYGKTPAAWRARSAGA